MKNVLFVTNLPSPYRVDFFNALGAFPDLDVTVAFLFRPKDNTERDAKWYSENYTGFHPIFLDRRVKLPGGQSFHPELKKLLKKNWDRIVFCGYSYLSMMHGIRFLSRRKIPFYLEIDGGLIGNDSALRLRIKRQCFSAAAGWFSTGKASDRYLLHYGAKSEGIVRYPFSSVRRSEIASASELTPEAKQARRERLSISEKSVLITVGQFIPRKGFDLLLRAAKELPRELGIYIVGGTPTGEYLDLVRDNDLRNVHFLDFMVKKELWQYYLAADLFVLPTREDIWGLVVNEAMACGLPVVTTENCVAGTELVEEGKNGFLVKTGDDGALRDGLLRALSSDLSAMGLAALETAKHYTIEEMAAAHHTAFCRGGKGDGTA